HEPRAAPSRAISGAVLFDAAARVLSVFWIEGLRFHCGAAGAAVEGEPLNAPRTEITRVERLNVVVLTIMSAVFIAARRQIPAAGGLACGFAGLAMATAVLPRVTDQWAVAKMRMILQGVALLSVYE